MKRLFLAATIVACIAGCATTGIQQSSESDLRGNSKIILEDRTGNVDGHKTPFAKEYIVAPGNHIVGVCGGGALCEKFYYIEFNAKPGFTYTVYSQARSISASNQAGYLVDTQGFGNQLRDGAPVVVSFDEIEQPMPSYDNSIPSSKSTGQINALAGTLSAASRSQTATVPDQELKAKTNNQVSESIKACVVAAALMETAYEQADESAVLPWQTPAGKDLISTPGAGPDFYRSLKKRWIMHHYQGMSIDDVMKDFAPNCAEGVLGTAQQN